jgi:hypothetical protein
MWMKVVMKKVETGVTIGIVLLCTVFVAACATPDITISSPKVYSDAQTRKILDQNRQGLGTGITTIQGASLQEVRGIREALQNQINISGCPRPNYLDHTRRSPIGSFRSQWTGLRISIFITQGT